MKHFSLNKKIIWFFLLFLIFINWVVNLNNVKAYNITIPKKIENNNFFINSDYERDVYYLNYNFVYKKDLRKTLKECLKVWKKYFINNKDIKQFCIFRIKEYLKNVNHPLAKKYRYLKYKELDFLYNKSKKPISNILLKYINKKEPYSKFTNSEENKVKDYLVFYNKGSVNINKIILNDLWKLNEKYKTIFNEDILLNSWYRSLWEQQSIYNKYIKLYWKWQKIATTPWFSEHHLWTAIDIHRIFIKNKQGKIIDNNYTWLKKHSWEFWFIQSYDENCIKDWIINEDWHYRYIWTYLSQKWKVRKQQNQNKCNIYFLKELNQIKR